MTSRLTRPKTGFIQVLGRGGTYLVGDVYMAGVHVCHCVGLLEKGNNPDQPEIEPTFELFIPKIPYQEFRVAQAFFGRVFEQYHAEAIVVLMLSPKTGEWHVEAPLQEVTAASADYQVTFLPPAGWYFAGDMHSHAGFPASHSTTDKHDEKGQFGFYITVGAQGDIVADLVLGNVRFQIDPDALIELPQTTFPNEWLDRVTYIPPKKVRPEEGDKEP